MGLVIKINPTKKRFWLGFSLWLLHLYLMWYLYINSFDTATEPKYGG